MGCGSCGSGGCSSDGCGQNGGCATGGCNKLNTYDWLGNMLSPGQTEVDNIYEVRFKNTRKSFYRNVNGLRLFIGDTIVVESDRGFDVGQLSLGGVMAELQMKKRLGKQKNLETPRIFRKANERDIELVGELRKKENALMIRTREIIRDLKLNDEMKMSDVEYQGDGTKAIFYYIADHRVDFRELIKILAREFRIRVEMKQIGLRHEAGLIGGIGACGRELCCSTWLTEFKTVSTSAARYQNLSLNPMKISGLCGRLKCCLNFELDSYLDAIHGFPKIEKIKTGKGMAYLQKTDVFKGTMWFSYPDETSWYPLGVEEVNKIKVLNEKGEIPESLSIISKPPVVSKVASLDFVDVVGTNIPEVDPRRKRGGNKNKRGKRRPGGPKGGDPRSRNKNPRTGNAKAKTGDSKSGTPQKSGNSQRNRNKPRSKGGNPRNENKNKGGNPRNEAKGGNPQAKKEGGNTDNRNKNTPNKNKGRNRRNRNRRNDDTKGESKDKS